MSRDRQKMLPVIRNITSLFLEFSSCSFKGLILIPLPDVLVETFSAIGTVGMTTGVTQHVFGLGRVVLIFLMYCGRVGSLSFSIALLEKRSRPPVRPPAEPLIIG